MAHELPFTIREIHSNSDSRLCRLLTAAGTPEYALGADSLYYLCSYSTLYSKNFAGCEKRAQRLRTSHSLNPSIQPEEHAHTRILPSFVRDFCIALAERGTLQALANAGRALQ